MAKIGRPGLSREKRAELRTWWKSSECASDIARALERTKGAIHHVLAFSGGIAPVARRRSPVALVLDEREEISRGIAAGRSIRGIAAGLGRSLRVLVAYGNSSRLSLESEIGGRPQRRELADAIGAALPVDAGTRRKRCAHELGRWRHHCHVVVVGRGGHAEGRRRVPRASALPWLMP